MLSVIESFLKRQNRIAILRSVLAATALIRSLLMAGRRVVATKPGGPATLQILSFDPPMSCAAGDVLVRVSRSTATYTDLLTINGHYRPQPPFPVTPGYDFVGTVTAIGDSVHTVAVGDMVAAMPRYGGMTTHVTIPSSEVYPIPRGMDASAAVAVVLTGVTAYQMLHRSVGNRLATPDKASILVHGCVGGTGAMLVALAKHMGIRTIIGTCSSRNLPAAQASGVTAAVAYDGNVSWSQEVIAASPGGHGVDVVFDPVLTGGYLARDVESLAPGGKVVAYGLTNKSAPGTFGLSAVAVFASLAMRHNLWSHLDGKDAEFYNVSSRKETHPADFASDLATLLRLVQDGALNPKADGGREWTLAEAPLALAAIAASTHRGKQIIICD